MRTLTLYMAALVSMLGIASAAQSAVIIDFVTAGPIAPSSTITVDIYLTATGASSVSGYQFAILYSGVDSGAGLVNAPTHGAAGSWTSGGPGLLLNTGTAYAAAISASTLTTPTDDIKAGDGTVHIGSIVFHVNGAAAVSGCVDCTAFGSTGDGITGSSLGVITFNGLTVVPEPTTASLLGLGLLGLTVAGRRRN
jgi:hypothetical protein